MKVKIKKLNENAIIPSYAKEGDAGLDLTAIWGQSEELYTEYGTGLAIEIPKGYVGLIFPRSSISNKANILSNSVGVIDSNYRGEIKFRFKVDFSIIQDMYSRGKDPDKEKIVYSVGDKIGQLIIIPYPEIEFEEVDELSSTERGDKGFGSTGN